MKYAVAFLLAWFFAVLHVSALPFLKVLGVTPDAVLIFAASWAVVRGQNEAMIVVPLAGLMRDLMSSDPVGTSVLAFAPLVLLAGVVRLQALETDFVATISVVAAGTVAFELIHMLVLGVTGLPIDVWYAISRVVIPGAIVNALFAPIIYLPVRWLSPKAASGLRGMGRLTSPL